MGIRVGQNAISGFTMYILQLATTSISLSQHYTDRTPTNLKASNEPFEDSSQANSTGNYSTPPKIG